MNRIHISPTVLCLLIFANYNKRYSLYLLVCITLIKKKKTLKGKWLGYMRGMFTCAVRCNRHSLCKRLPILHFMMTNSHMPRDTPKIQQGLDLNWHSQISLSFFCCFSFSWSQFSCFIFFFFTEGLWFKEPRQMYEYECMTKDISTT